MQRRDARIAAALLCVFGGLAYATSAGITCTNDGSTYALTRSLAATGTVRIDAFVAFTGGLDVATYGGHSYSDRAPGLAFLAVPFAFVGERLGPRPSQPRSNFDDGAPQIPFVLLLTALAAGAACALTYAIARKLDLARGPALVAVVALGAGSLVWKDGARFYRHVPAAAFLAGAVLLVLDLERMRSRSAGRVLTWSAAIGALIGLATSCDQTACLGVLGIGGYVLARSAQARGPSRLGLVAIGGLLGGAVPVALLLTYNYACFGHALTNAYALSKTGFPTVGAAFAAPFGVGLRSLLFAFFVGRRMHPFGSLLSISPALLLGLLGFVVLAWRRQLAATLLLAGITVPVIAAMSKHSSFWGGGDSDYRYIECVTPFLAVGLAVVVDLGWRIRTPARAAVLTPCVALTFLSVVLTAAHIREGYGHAELPGAPLFPNAVNLPLWALACAGWLFLYALVEKRRAPLDEEAGSA